MKGDAKKVIISAPSADAPMYTCSVNLDSYDSKHVVISFVTLLIPYRHSGNDPFRSPMHHAQPTVSRLSRKLSTTNSAYATTATQKTVDSPSNKDWRIPIQDVFDVDLSYGEERLIRDVKAAIKGPLNWLHRRPCCLYGFHRRQLFVHLATWQLLEGIMEKRKAATAIK